MKQAKDTLTELEKKDYGRVVGQHNWVLGISRPDIPFYTCDDSKSFKMIL